jgi:uncharacterized protein (DUF488 family)
MLTFGHGRLKRDGLASLLTTADVSGIVDVRRFPGSRTNPAAARGAVADLADEIGIAYRWDERLGGRRALSAAEDRESPDQWWRVKAFRAYAAWTRSDAFRAALDDLTEEPDRAALMCSEAVWWRCHRRIISDVLVVELGIRVQHLMPDGRLVEHVPSEGLRLGADGRAFWDARSKSESESQSDS